MNASGRIIRRGGAGGRAIQYDYVSAASYANLPSIAEENTFGFITTLAIADVLIANDRPAGRPTGEIRVKIGSKSLRLLTILEDPLVTGYVLTAYQYNGTSWVLLEAYLRESATWKRIRSEFYNAGAVGLVGSFSGTSTGAANYTIGSNTLVLRMTTGGTSGYARVNGANPINVTDFDTLKIDYARYRGGSSGSHKAYLFLNPTVLSGTNAGFSTGVAGVDLSTGAKTLSLDVSALTGLQYIHVALGKSSYYETDDLTVNAIYGE